jgi:hypothetical protein
VAEKPTLGLTVHSNLARSWAASGRALVLGHAERTMAHIEMASAIQNAHWEGVQEHLAARNERYEV